LAEAIRPFSQVTFIYEKGGEVITRKGILHIASHETSGSSMMTNSVLKIFLEPYFGKDSIEDNLNYI